ncbi:hypothetical protein Tco_1001530, partial [Tanacetum coccineum]
MTPDLTCPSTYQLLRSSSGCSGPNMSFDMPASPEHLSSLARASLVEIMAEHKRFRLEEANRLRLEEGKMLQLAREKNKKRHEFMNSTHVKNILAKLPPRKKKKYRQHVNDPCMDLSRLFHYMDTIWLSDNIEKFPGQPWQLKCKFPWSDDYTVDRNFWLTLVCLDPARKGWLTKETCGWTICHMWHVRPENANWAMVSSYFVQLLMQNNMPLFYANGDRREQIMELQRLIGSNIVADSLRLLRELQDDDLEKARVVKVLFLVVLDRAKVFDKNGIDPSDYSITFRLVDNVPEKGLYFVIVLVAWVEEEARLTDYVDDEIVLHDDSKYEGMGLDGYIYVGGSSTGCVWLDERVSYDGGSLPANDKDGFSNDVVLDAGGSSVADNGGSTLPFIFD